MSPGGRRPGNVDTRDDIIQAAKRVFARDGYDGTSLRGVAREAAVDAALVHHYFDGKSDLFVAAMSLPFDPRQVADESANQSPEIFVGARVVEGFLTMWDGAEGTGSSFASCVSGMAASSAVADAIREFVMERVWRRIDGDDDGMFHRRHALVSSQLMGLAFTRYIMRVPPVSTATPSEIGAWAGPTLDRYILGDLNDPS